jgi:magnesium transporter
MRKRPTHFVKRLKKIGLEPGSLVYVGDRDHASGRIGLIEYSADGFREEEVAGPDGLHPPAEPDRVLWINVEGAHDPAVVGRIGTTFGLHPLVQEDILNTTQRPKLEDMDDYLFVTLRMIGLHGDGTAAEIFEEQVSLVLGRNFVLSFQDGVEGDVFGPLRDRLRTNKGRSRRSGADYLAYSMLDAVVDNYFTVLEKVGEELEELEERLIEAPGHDDLAAIYSLKRRFLFLRRSVWPLREVLSKLERGESDLVQPATLPYLRDVYDHTIQVIDTVETYRDMLGGLVDVYMSSISLKLNQVMKVLTVIATIFMPLTFIAGVYGMNFEHMPELKWHYGYYASLGLMAVVAGIMVYYFKRAKWL